ncbi:MAG TPA: DNA methyltransferase [Candidatus Saccharimonadales bacterium]|nr:DNA methyltransferase [Candidatus Saccharimonadales bacterium]
MREKTLCILGRQPAIGRAELESLLGATHVTPVGNLAMSSDVAAQDIPFARLGGTVKLAVVVTSFETRDWRSVQAELTKTALALAQDIAEGKIQLGISAYGLRVNPRQLLGAGLEIKKTLREHGYSVRLVPNQDTALSSAQVLHNHLTGERGIELLAVQAGQRVIIARTLAEQDINAYAARDQNRPKRDARVGMLPPKLAQTIVNLATGPLPASADAVILDPFCGTGVILQEALLMGYVAYGSDLEPRMIDYSRQNLHWLNAAGSDDVQLQVGDATTHHWQHPFSAVASETYLGRPLSTWPMPDKLQEIMGACNVIIEKFLKNMAAQTKTGLRLCLAVPAWRDPAGRIYHLKTLDHLGELGYNRVSFEHARDSELTYFREGQLVARELLVITRN